MKDRIKIIELGLRAMNVKIDKSTIKKILMLNSIIELLIKKRNNK